MTDRQLTAALAGSATAATTAPALRHSQAWRWVLHTASLDLYADPDAQLSREETLVTCGGAVHRARVALAADGLGVRVDLLPDDDPDHVATLTPTGAVEISEAARTLAETAELGHRSTASDPDPTRSRRDRGAASRPRLMAPLVDAARAEGAQLRTLEPGDVDRLADATPLLARSAAVPRDVDTAFAVLYGGDATPEAWLRAGQALSAVDLGARMAGLSVLASASVVELSASRDLLRRMLPAGVTPYLALRISPAKLTEPAGR